MHSAARDVMDMDTTFDLEVRMHCPRADVVHDLFHLVGQVRLGGYRPRPTAYATIE
ncbi:transposase [Achromobacter xylosoxidans]